MNGKDFADWSLETRAVHAGRVEGDRKGGNRKGGNRKGCPYIPCPFRVKPHDKMNVIGHNHEFIQRNRGKPSRQCLPDILDNTCQNWVLQNTLTPLSTQGDKIGPRRAIIVPSQSDRSAVMPGRVIARHFCLCTSVM